MSQQGRVRVRGRLRSARHVLGGIAVSQQPVPPKHSSGIEIDQTVQLNLDLDVRGLETCGDEVDDQPCEAPVRYPAPYRTELAKDAVAPLKIRELSGRVGRWGSSAH